MTIAPPLAPDWRPTHAPGGDPYRAHTEGCRRVRTLSFELRSARSVFESAGHATYCCECGAFQPCMDAIAIARAELEQQ